MEVDFTEYYQADLRDLWRPGSGMTIRWVIAHLYELPIDSRIKRHYGGEEGIFDIKDHLIADVRDILLMVQYFTAINAMKEFKYSQQQKVLRGLPKRPRRPGEKEPEIRFATPEELKMLFPDKALMKRRKILQQRRRQQA